MVSRASSPSSISYTGLSYTYTVTGYSPISKPKLSPRRKGLLSAFWVPPFWSLESTATVTITASESLTNTKSASISLPRPQPDRAQNMADSINIRVKKRFILYSPFQIGP